MHDPWKSPADAKTTTVVLQKALAGAGGIRCAFIFGSLASGTYHAESDVDIMIIGDIDGRKIAACVRDLSDTRLGRLLNWVNYTEVQWASRVSARNHFIRTVLNAERIPLVGDPAAWAWLEAEKASLGA